MYQRRASYKPAAMQEDKISTMTLVKFFKAAKEDLERRGLADEAFRFEMLEDHFRNRYKPGLTYSPTILGF